VRRPGTLSVNVDRFGLGAIFGISASLLRTPGTLLLQLAARAHSLSKLPVHVVVEENAEAGMSTRNSKMQRNLLGLLRLLLLTAI
jgi:hypothetical protein